MRKKYDIVYFSNTPSFYKMALCNELAKSHSLLLVLQGKTSQAVNCSDGNLNFDIIYLYNGDMDKRPKIKVFFKLLKLMSSIKCRKILYSGWMAVEYNIYSFLSPRSKNVIICESSNYECHFDGLMGIIKKTIINRMSIALPSGIPHAKLFEEIGFKGKTYITGGVGLIKKGPRPIMVRKHKERALSYICVARLIPVKNIEFLIRVFNKNGKNLTIVGKGELEIHLKQIAKDNIRFLGFVENNQMGEIYLNHDVLILPSKSEVWGLVVDEALYWGLPVIVSDMVGSNIDLVKNPRTGVIFDHKSELSLEKAIAEIESNYEIYVTAVNSMNFEERDFNQIDAYNKIFE